MTSASLLSCLKRVPSPGRGRDVAESSGAVCAEIPSGSGSTANVPLVMLSAFLHSRLVIFSFQ